MARSPAAPRRLRAAGAARFPQEPGTATRRRGGVLRAALHRSAAHLDRDRAVASHRPGAAPRDAGALPRLGRARPVAADRRRARRVSRAPRRDGLGARRDAAFLQLARLHGARECDVDRLLPPRGGAPAPLPGLGGPALLLHPLPRRGSAGGDAGGGGPRGHRPGHDRIPRPLLVARPALARGALPGRRRGRNPGRHLGLLVMPVGRLRMRHALIGGATAALLWELTRHLLVWYFARLSQVNVVYGSLTTAIVVLFSLEILATLLLFGAQVISEYERLERSALRP